MPNFIKKTKKWQNFDFNYTQSYDKPPREGTGESDEMRQFFKDFKSDLNAMLKGTGFKIYRMKKNYYDVTAVISNENETKFCYLSAGDARFNDWTRVLIRTMAHDKDYTGGPNNYSPINESLDMIERLMKTA